MVVMRPCEQVRSGTIAGGAELRYPGLPAARMPGGDLMVGPEHARRNPQQQREQGEETEASFPQANSANIA